MMRLGVRTDGGQRLVALTERTRYIRRLDQGEMQDASPEDVSPGDGVAVYGPFSRDGRALVADVVVLLPRRAPQ